MKGLFTRRDAALSHKKPVDALGAISHMAMESPPPPDSRPPTNGEPVRTGSNFLAAPCPAWHSAEDHAVALLQWMQGLGGRVGEVPAMNWSHPLVKIRWA